MPTAWAGRRVRRGSMGRASYPGVSGPEKIGAPAEPPLQVPLGRLGTLGEERFGDRARRFDQVGVVVEIGKAQERRPALPGAEIFPGAAQQEILARDDKAVRVFENHAQALACGLAERILIEQDAHRFGRAAPDASTQLMELREP